LICLENQQEGGKKASCVKIVRVYAQLSNVVVAAVVSSASGQQHGYHIGLTEGLSKAERNYSNQESLIWGDSSGSGLRLVGGKIPPYLIRCLSVL